MKPTIQKDLFRTGSFNLTTDPLPPDTFTVGGFVFPKCQFEEVILAQFSNAPLPNPKRQ